VSPEVIQQIDRLAEEQGITRSQLVARVLQAYLRRRQRADEARGLVAK